MENIIPLPVLNFQDGFDRLTHVVAAKLSVTPESIYLSMQEDDFGEILANEPSSD